MADLLTDIELTAIQIGEKYYPRLRILGMVKPLSISEDDYFLLEKFQIDKEDPDQMTALSQALTYQTVLYYMNVGIFMSSSIWMSEYDLLVAPQYLDIQDKFELGVQYLIDTDADIDKYLYVYRIIYYNIGTEGRSNYVAGVQYVDFREDAVKPDIFPIPVSSGTGELYREGRDGRIIVKGFPNILFNPRYKGPLEYEKAYGRRTAIFNTFTYISNKLGELETSISDMWSELVEITNTGIQNYRSR